MKLRPLSWFSANCASSSINTMSLPAFRRRSLNVVSIVRVSSALMSFGSIVPIGPMLILSIPQAALTELCSETRLVHYTRDSRTKRLKRIVCRLIHHVAVEHQVAAPGELWHQLSPEKRCLACSTWTAKKEAVCTVAEWILTADIVGVSC